MIFADVFTSTEDRTTTISGEQRVKIYVISAEEKDEGRRVNVSCVKCMNSRGKECILERYIYRYSII